MKLARDKWMKEESRLKQEILTERQAVRDKGIRTDTRTERQIDKDPVFISIVTITTENTSNILKFGINIIMAVNITISTSSPSFTLYFIL